MISSDGIEVSTPQKENGHKEEAVLGKKQFVRIFKAGTGLVPQKLKGL